MGRETKLLLGLLATLLGVFLGVLSMKLLVPRPPAGAGPDIHADVASTAPQDLVEPPRFEPPPAGGIAAEAAPRDTTATFDRRDPIAAAAERPRVVHDPFVARSAFTAPAASDLPPPSEDLAPAGPIPPAAPVRSAPAARLGPPPTAGSSYVAQDGDSWWSLAETVYGDGRFYRALFAWNRAVDPRVSLVPGTPLDLPAPERLRAAWPALVPGP